MDMPAANGAKARERRGVVPTGVPEPLRVVSGHKFSDFEAAWRLLELNGIESPGQSYDFLAHWIETFDIPADRQLFIMVYAGDRPVAGIALHRRRIWGMNVLSPFPGGHVGVNAPLIDADYVGHMSVREREKLFELITSQLKGAHLAYLCCIPEMIGGYRGLFDGFSLSAQGDELHRAVFCSWEVCDREQRTRSRRKHDKQQGAKLEAMGAVRFETLDAGEDVDAVLDVMFQQRADRFRQQGINDPFKTGTVRDFYRGIFASGETLKGRLHVLRLDGAIVAVRYNLVLGDRMFCLISSMSTAPAIQPGSPGKQCLLRVMQTEFDNGFKMFDMGAGMTDEKRHWCNQHIPLTHYYVPLTPWGYVFTQSHRAYQALKGFVKNNPQFFGVFRDMRAKLAGKSRG